MEEHSAGWRNFMFFSDAARAAKWFQRFLRGTDVLALQLSTVLSPVITPKTKFDSDSALKGLGVDDVRRRVVRVFRVDGSTRLIGSGVICGGVATSCRTSRLQLVAQNVFEKPDSKQPLMLDFMEQACL